MKVAHRLAMAGLTVAALAVFVLVHFFWLPFNAHSNIGDCHEPTALPDHAIYITGPQLGEGAPVYENGTTLLPIGCGHGSAATMIRVEGDQRGDWRDDDALLVRPAAGATGQPQPLGNATGDQNTHVYAGVYRPVSPVPYIGGPIVALAAALVPALYLGRPGQHRANALAAGAGLAGLVAGAAFADEGFLTVLGTAFILLPAAIVGLVLTSSPRTRGVGAPALAFFACAAIAVFIFFVRLPQAIGP